jgi:actin-like ATPase involved in cell morphogenesis
MARKDRYRPCMAYRLGVDLGTTFTAAAVDDGTGPTMLGLGNRALTVPSVVYLGADGGFLFGEAADRRAAAEPARSAREFKRRIGDTVPILLAGQPFSPQALSAKLLAWVVGVATERQGGEPGEVVVTYPANWGGYKRELLVQLTTLADLPGALTCTEPEAAATQYAARAALSPGDTLAVYDLGGGTFDVCVLEKQETGFRVLGSPDGVEHLGGIDFDEAVFQHAIGLLGDRVADLDLDDPDVTSGLARLRRECIDAKEALSSDVEATIGVALPGLTTSLRITRTEIERLITGPLRDTLDATQRALRSAGVEAGDLATVVLVGGSSRIPLVSHLLQSEFGVRTAMDTHPKHDIALGAVRYHPPDAGQPATAAPAAPAVTQWPTRGKSAPPPPAPPPPPPSPPPPTEPVRAPEPPPGPDTVQLPEPVEETPAGPPVWRPPDTVPTPATPAEPGVRRLPSKPLLIGVGTAVLLLVAAAATYALTRGDDEQATNDQPDGTSSTPPEPERVFGVNTILLPVSDGPDSDSQIRAVTTDGRDRGAVVKGPGSYDAPWVSRDGSVVGYRQADSVATENKGVIMIMTADGTPSPLINGSPPAGINCRLRAIWYPSGDRVLLNCLEDLDGDRKFETSLWTAPVGADHHVEGSQLQLLLDNDTPTEDTPNGSPDSTLRAVSFLPDGTISVEYAGGQEPGIHLLAPGGALTRLTSGEADDEPAASPTSQLVAFARDGDLYVASTDGSEPPCDPPRKRTTDEETGTALCNLTTGITSAPDQIASNPAWSWDGKRIAFTVGSEDGPQTVDLISLDGGDDPTALVGQPGYIGAPAWGPR